MDSANDSTIVRPFKHAEISILNYSSQRDSMGPTYSHCAVHPVRSKTILPRGPVRASSPPAWREPRSRLDSRCWPWRRGRRLFRTDLEQTTRGRRSNKPRIIWGSGEWMSRTLFRRLHSPCRAIRPGRAKRGLRPKFGVQLNGAVAGSDGLSQIVFAGFKPHVQRSEEQSATPAYARAYLGSMAMALANICRAKFEALAPHLIKELPAAEVIIVSLYLAGGHLFDFSSFFFGEHDAQGAGDVLGDFVLDGKDFLKLTVIPLRPKYRRSSGNPSLLLNCSNSCPHRG